MVNSWFQLLASFFLLLSPCFLLLAPCFFPLAPAPFKIHNSRFRNSPFTIYHSLFKPRPRWCLPSFGRRTGRQSAQRSRRPPTLPAAGLAADPFRSAPSETLR